MPVRPTPRRILTALILSALLGLAACGDQPAQDPARDLPPGGADSGADEAPDTAGSGGTFGG